MLKLHFKDSRQAPPSGWSRNVSPWARTSATTWSWLDAGSAPSRRDLPHWLLLHQRLRQRAAHPVNDERTLCRYQLRPATVCAWRVVADHRPGSGRTARRHRPALVSRCIQGDAARARSSTSAGSMTFGRSVKRAVLQRRPAVAPATASSSRATRCWRSRPGIGPNGVQVNGETNLPRQCSSPAIRCAWPGWCVGDRALGIEARGRRTRTKTPLRFVRCCRSARCSQPRLANGGGGADGQPVDARLAQAQAVPHPGPNLLASALGTAWRSRRYW